MFSTQATTALSSLSPALPAASTALSSTSPGTVGDLERLTNESLYASLVADTSLLDTALELLIQRLKPIIFNIARDYMPILSWDFSDALQEARILLWQLITHNRYKPGAPFHTFFSRCYRNRLNNLYRDYLLRNPVTAGAAIIGWEGHEAVIMGVVKFNEDYISRYKAAQSVRNRKLYEKRRAAAGMMPREVLTEDQKAERKAAARQRACERNIAWQRENREAYNKRRAEIRREKAAGTFVDRRKRVCATTV